MSESPSLPSPALSRRSVRWLLVLLLLSAAALRLAYGLYHPGTARFYDERFSLQNVHALLQEGALKPANGYYATLGYLPQTLLLAAVDRAGGEIYTEEGAPPRVRPLRASRLFTPLAYRLCRGVQILWGGLSLWLLFLLGRRLVSPQCGLLAAWILACSPWHIRASVVFKPDIVLLATSLAALLAICSAVAVVPRWIPYLRAGGAIAAALSSKLTGGITALPLVAATALQGRREPRRLMLLVAAGAASVGLFLLLNPQWQMYPRFLDRLSEEYADKAELHGAERRQIPLRSALFLVESSGLGAVFGVLALVGFGLFALRLRHLPRFGEPGSVDLQRFVVWCYPLLHVALYAAKTPHFKANNVLPILPVGAFLAAWTGLRIWDWIRGRWRLRLPRRPSPKGVALGAGLAVVLFLGLPALLWVHHRILPATTDRAFEHLAERAPRGAPLQVRLLAGEVPDSPWEGWTTRKRPALALLPVADPEYTAPRSLAAADAVLLLTDRPADRLDREDPAVRLFLDSADPSTVEIFGPAWPRLRGPTVLLAFHPWQEVGESLVVPLRAPTRQPEIRRGRLPSVPREDRITLEVWIPGLLRPAEEAVPELRLLWDGQATAAPLLWLRRSGEGHLYSTGRLAVPEEGAGVALRPPSEEVDLRGVGMVLRRWQSTEGSAR